MNTTNQLKLPLRREFLDRTLVKCTGVGLIGGLIGTFVMDCLLMGALSIFGLHPLSCFSIVGDTVAQVLLNMSVEVMGGAPLGVATHYLVGPVVGAIYGIAVSQVRSFRTNSMKKDILQAVIYVEVLSQPMLAMTPVLLKMSLSDTVRWFGGSFVMHILWGVVVGGSVHYLLKQQCESKGRVKNEIAVKAIRLFS